MKKDVKDGIQCTYIITSLLIKLKVDNYLFEKSIFFAGSDQINDKLDSFIKRRLETSTSTPRAKTIEEFKILFKYLAFVACSAKAPIRQKMLEATLSLIDKAGSIENIQRWCIWTPYQLSLLEMADQMPRVVLIGGNGTGKTLMLETYGLKTTKENPNLCHQPR